MYGRYPQGLKPMLSILPLFAKFKYDKSTRIAYPFHAHDQVFEIVYVIEGNITFRKQNSCFDIFKNEICIFKPNEAHEVFLQTFTPCEFYVLHIDLSFKHDRWSFWPEKRSTPISFFHSIDLNTLQAPEGFKESLDQLMTEHRSPDNSSIDQVMELFQNNLIGILKTYRDYFKNPILTSINPIQTLEKIDQYIMENLNMDITCHSLAHELVLSERHLSRMIRNITGTTPMKYVQNFRLNQAKKLLQDPNKKVSEIADELAYSSSSQLEKNFKSKTHAEIEEFRNALQEKLDEQVCPENTAFVTNNN